LRNARRSLPALLLLLLAAGCGGEDSQPPAERADAPAKPPHGWKTVRNRAAGFTLSVPRNWTARVKNAATLIRSKDKLLVITVAADRGEEGRDLTATAYAKQTLEALPDFEGSETASARRVRGSPYRSARVDGAGTLKTSKRPQRIVVVAYRRPKKVMYALVGFFNPKLPASFYEPTLRRVLRSLRGQPPRGSGAA
jgi:hypothetical protein